MFYTSVSYILSLYKIAARVNKNKTFKTHKNIQEIQWEEI